MENGQIDLSLVSNQDLLGELKKRFPTLIFSAKIYLNERGTWVTLDTSQGDQNLCAGLALEVALKNIYFKIQTQGPTNLF